MPIQFKCPGCGKGLKVGLGSSGKSIICPSCKNSCDVPTVQARGAPISPDKIAGITKGADSRWFCPKCGTKMKLKRAGFNIAGIFLPMCPLFLRVVACPKCDYKPDTFFGESNEPKEWPSTW